MTQVLPGVQESAFPRKLALMAGIGFLIFAVFPLLFGEFQISFLGKLFLFGSLAIALDLVWGFTGILSFAQGVFFSLGGYAMGYYLKLNLTAGSSDYGGNLPEFMVSNGLEQLPWFIAPLQYFPIAMVAMVLVPAGFAYLIGWFIFTSRVSGVYITIISLAIASALNTFFVSQQAYTNGTNGLSDIAPLSFFGAKIPPIGLYWMCLVFTTAVLIGAWWLTKSNLGLILRSIKENEARVSFLGYNIASYKIFIWTLSAGIAGIAGGLFVALNQFISPVYMAVPFGTQVVIWVAIGGRGTLIGPLAAALILGQVQNYAEQITQDWQLIIGVLLLIVVLFIPNGLMSLVPKQFGQAKSPSKSNSSHSDAGYLQAQLVDWITPLQKLIKTTLTIVRNNRPRC
ncbi:MAG: urea ABC transporter permease subunit UrtC [Cyanobacteria bacterium SW_9_44_58]|nr:MAG: urea ABC transporter permease subunit UrtC [Cyanobacteria bacterium SW_9_44_58]